MTHFIGSAQLFADNRTYAVAALLTHATELSAKCIPMQPNYKIATEQV